MPSRKIVKGGTIVSPEGTTEADLIIEGELVAGIVRDAQPGPDDEVIDATGLLVLPGVVDAHTHIQLDTGIYKTADNWEIGTKAAAAGGVTTVIDFATQLPGQTVDEALDNRLKETEPAIIDYGLHCMITDLPHGKEVEMLGRLVERGVPSFKVYTTYRPNYYMDDAMMLRLMRATKEVGGLVMVHAENDAIVTDATEQLVRQGKTGWQYHGQGRPAIAEQEAISRMVFLAEQTRAPVYIVHCTTWESISIIHQAQKADYLDVICETCPQYLVLDERRYEGDHPEWYILQPPLRVPGTLDWEPQTDMWDWLWGRELVYTNVISVISTDSCDYTLAQKTEYEDFTKTPGGLPGVETLLPLIYTYGVVDDGLGFDLRSLVTKLCSNPAKIFGLYPHKGTLMVGSDADVVLYDPEPEWEIHHEDLHYVAGYSPYEGMKIKGRVMLTLSRGEVVYRYGTEDEFEGAQPGRGRFVPGDPFDASLMG